MCAIPQNLCTRERSVRRDSNTRHPAAQSIPTDHKDLISRCNGVKSLSMLPLCNHQLEHSRHYATSRRRHSSASSNSTRSQELGLIRRRILLIGANAPSHCKEFQPLRPSFSLSLSLLVFRSFSRFFLLRFRFSVFSLLTSFAWVRRHSNIVIVSRNKGAPKGISLDVR